MRPVGIKNIGNTCFVNAAVQMVLRVSPLREALRGHTCEMAKGNCVWCGLRDQARGVVDGGRMLATPHVSVQTRRGRFGTVFALGPCVPSGAPGEKRWREFDAACEQSDLEAR